MLWYSRVQNDNWFEACKDDRTCLEHWEEDFVYNKYFTNSCPNDPRTSCRTFEDVYGNGEDLCNKLYGNGIFYSTDSNNCTVMAFDNSLPNPNFKLTFPRSGTSSISMTAKLGSIIMSLLMLPMNAATI